MKFAPLAVALALVAGAASAQSSNTRNYHEYGATAQPCSAGTCTRDVPTYAEMAKLKAAGGVGMPMVSVSGYVVSVCADEGHTLSGAGTLEAYVYAPWLPDVSHSALGDLDIADVWKSGQRCLHFPDLPVYFRGARKVMYRANGVTVSGGTGLSVYINGQEVG